LIPISLLIVCMLNILQKSISVTVNNIECLFVL